MPKDGDEDTCVCIDGSIQCEVENCDEWADICQGLTTCWTHYVEDKKE